MEQKLWDMLIQLHKNRRMDCFFIFNRNGEKIGDFLKA
jgi:hypothetical protein